MQSSLLRSASFSLLGIIPFCFLATLTFISVKRLPPVSYLPIGPFQAKFSVAWEKHLKVINDTVVLHANTASDLTIWSTYAGLLESNNNVFHPKEDYIIHALGKNRRAGYVATFRSLKPDYVQTLRRSHFITYTKNRDYEQWLRNTSWDFYEDVLNNYDILATTDRSIIWKKRDDNWVDSSNIFKPISLLSDGVSIEVPKQPTMEKNSLIVVKLRYQVHNPWRRVPFLGGLPRYMVKLENVANNLPVSLPPYQEEVRFPLMIAPGCNPKLIFETQSLLPGATLTVAEVSYKIIELTDKQELFLHD